MGGGFVDGVVASPVSQGLFYARTDVGGAYRWDEANGRWIPITDMFPMSQGNYLGIESIAPDPVDGNLVYAAAGMYLTAGNGVILSSTDQGNSWTVNNIGIAMGGNATGRGMGERLAVDPNKNNVLFFGSRNNGLWQSTNSASNWSQVGTFPTYGASSYGLPVVIIDGQGGTPGTASATIFVGAASTGAGSNLYVSTNSGVNWSPVSGGPSGLMAHHAALASDGNLWLAYSNDYGPYNVTGVTLVGQIWKYNTGSGAWSNVTPSTWGGMAGGLSVDAQNPQHVIVSTLDWYNPDRILATADGGANWTVIANPNAGYGGPWSTYNINGAQYLYFGGSLIGTGATNWVEGLSLDPFNSNRAFYGTGEGIFESSNIQTAGAPGAVQWNFQDAGLEETVPLDLVSSVNGAFLGAVGDVGGMRNTSLSSPASGGMYTNPRFGNTNGIDFAGLNPNIVARVGTGNSKHGAYSMDNGQTWTPFAVNPAGTNNNNDGQIAVAADGSRFLWALPGNPSVVYSTDNGSSWASCGGLPVSVTQIASDRVNPGMFYATKSGDIYVSTNGGANFAVAASFAGTGRPRVVFGIQGELWVATNGGNLYRFTNLGGSPVTTTQISSVSNSWGVGFGAAASGQSHPAVYLIGTVSGQYGFYRCDDGVGTSWTRINDNQHQYGWLQGNFIAGDENIYGRCYLTTGGRGYIYGDYISPTPTPTFSPTPTATDTPCYVNGTPCTPTASPTATNTPTPTPTPYLPGPVVAMPNILTNGQSLCAFKVPEAGATLKVYIYTVAGELAAAVEGQAGSSLCAWDSSAVASGLYLVRARVDDYDGTFRWQKLKLLVLH